MPIFLAYLAVHAHPAGAALRRPPRPRDDLGERPRGDAVLRRPPERDRARRGAPLPRAADRLEDRPRLLHLRGRALPGPDEHQPDLLAGAERAALPGAAARGAAPG